MRRCVSVTLTFEDGSERVYRRRTDDYLVMADSPSGGFRDIAMSGGEERNAVMLKILDQVVTENLMRVNKIGPDAAKEGREP